MAENNHMETSTKVENIDTYSLLRDLFRSLWAIVLGAAAVAMIVNLVSSATYESTYTTSTTFVVSSKDANGSIYSNLGAAQTMAENFTNILNSDVLKKKVCQDLNMETFDATATASAVNSTNLLNLSVTADSPRKAYSIIRSIMNNYTELTQYVSGNMILQVLQEPVVPGGVDVAFNANQQTKRWFVYTFLALVALFLLLSYQKNTIKSQKDMEEKLAARSLGMIYYERGSLRQLRKARKVKKRAVGYGDTDANESKDAQGEPDNSVIATGLLVNHVSSSFEYVERYKKISSMIINAAKKNQAKSIVVTSVNAREGKSTAAANIALTLAKQEYKVALVDADLRHPSLSELIGKPVKPGHGIEDVLTGKIDVATAMQYDKASHLYMLLGSQNVQNSTEVLSGSALKDILNKLEEEMDYIIIDTPCMSKVADAEAIAHMTDMSVLVVGYDKVLVNQLNDAIDALQDSSPNMAGCILNAVKTLPGTRRATGGYGGYGRYGSRYGKYGKYGNYGRYGAYGAYGHYSRVRDNTKSEETK